MVDQENEWARQWAVTTGRCVRRWRGMRKLSAQKLADRCDALGLPGLTRTVITKLENGRKESVSTAELMVLARALEVPPVMLMFPFGEHRMFEISPGEFVGPLDAMFRVAGLNPDSVTHAAEPGSALDLFIIHRQIVDAMLAQRRLWQEDVRLRTWKTPWDNMIREFTWDDLADATGLPPLPHEEQMLKDFQYNAGLLRTTRNALRNMGFEPPPLPPQLTRVEGEEEDEGEPDGSR